MPGNIARLDEWKQTRRKVHVMRKISVIMAAALVLLFSAGAANALEFKVKGNWGVSLSYLKDSYKYDLIKDRKDEDADTFWATSRVRTQIDFIASENLMGRLHFEIGKMEWGRNDNDEKSAPLDADQVNIKTKSAFIDWRIPDTDIQVRMGIQPIALPQAFGENPVFNDDAAGIVINWQINEAVGITAFWSRAFDANWIDTDGRQSDELDFFGLTLPIKVGDHSITPWGAYAFVGNDAGFFNDYLFAGKGAGRDNYGWDKRKTASDYGGGTSTMWWLGIAYETNMFDPLTFKFDAMYGALNGKNEAPDSKGYFLDAALQYKLSWGIPGIFGWYASGDDADISDYDNDRMPIVGLDTGFAISTFGFADGYGLRGDQAAFMSPLGTWGVGFEIKKMKFWSKLTHDLQFIYAQGTNNREAAIFKQVDGGSKFSGVDFAGFYLTHHDKYYEVDFNHFYKIYDNLTMGLELGLIHLDLDEDTWRNDLYATTNGWKVALTWKYQF